MPQQAPPIDPYFILSVTKDTPVEVIKKSFRELSQKHHPDKPEGDEAKFLLIKEAWDILGEPRRKKNYDETGLTVTLPPVKDRVNSMITGLLNQVMTNMLSASLSDARGSNADIPTEECDIVRLCKATVAADIHQLTITDQGLKNGIAMVEAILGRTTTDDKENLFDKVCEEKIRRMSQQFYMNKDTHELFLAIDAKLDDYRDKINQLN